MKTVPVISIVTPSYNQGPYLAATIESVLCQEGDFRIDYIVMDGGSSDDSVAVIRRYRQLLDSGAWQIRCKGITMRWTSEKDRGQSDALAKGFRTAEGEIFSWLNSDDTLLPGTLGEISEFFQRNSSVAFVYGKAYYCDQTGRRIGEYPSEEFSLQRLAYFNFMPQPSTFFRRSAYEAVGGIDDSLQYAMDYDLAAKIVKHLPCAHLPRFLSMYRLHEDAKTVHPGKLHDYLEEGVAVAVSNFGRAPLNLLYGACYHSFRQRLPETLGRHNMLLIPLSACHAIYRALLINKGINRHDLALMNLANFSKMFKSHRSLLLGDRSVTPGAPL